MYDKGVDVDNELNYVDPYEVIFSFSETPEIKKWCMNTMFTLYESCKSEKHKSKVDLVDCIETFVKSHLDNQDLSVSFIANEYGLSTAYLSNCYSANRNSTLTKFINNERLIMACYYLENTDYTINEIFHKIGFQSESYFYSKFKKKYGNSPSEYRKNKQ